MIRPLTNTVCVPFEAYTNQHWFEQEQKNLFSGWICSATLHEFKTKNDYVVNDTALKSTVLVNTSSGIKSFSNYCPHRLNRIHEGSGNRPLICKYHSWMFDEHGYARCPAHFEIRPKLEEYLVQTSGQFVFSAQTLESSFADYLEDETFKCWLEVVSENLGDPIETFDIPIEANWKLVVENTLEAYHINSVHPHTFAKAGLSQETLFQSSASHSQMLILRDTKNSKRDRLREILKDRPWHPDGFFHALYFPNLSIGSLFGLTTYIGHILPVSPTRTIFRYRLFHCKIPDPTEQTDLAQQLVGNAASLFTKQTLLEDKEICESVQRGMSELQGILPGYLLPQEIRIQQFREAYISKMGT